jgi:adenylate kinase family enzyme
LEIALKQKKRSNNTEFSKEIVKLIIDISEEAFVYQQINDTDNIDSRVWREWMQLFVNDRSVFEEDNKQIDPNSDNDLLLDECEFLDYLYFIGQWKTDLIPITSYTQININELFQEANTQTTADQNAKTNPKQAKPTPNVKEKEVVEYKEDDPENLIIHKEPYKNNYLGDLVDMLIDLKYNEDDKVEEKKNMFSYIPLKLCMIGHSFSGKKSQAKILSENFPFKIYFIDDLIRRSLEVLERLEKPFELANVSSTLSSTKKNQIEQIQRERQEEELKCAEIKKIATQIREKLINGEPVSDDIYVNLIVENIRLDFPFKSDTQIYEEIMNKHKRLKEIQYELDKIKFELESNEISINKKVKIKQNEEQILNQELMKISLDSLVGFVIVDFPNSYNQAKLLERTLTGYISEIEKPLSQCQIFKENASLILDKSKKIEKPKELIQSGMDIIFHLDVPSQECIRRAFGRRIDPDTNIIYHLEDNPPSTDEGRICEGLLELDEPYDSQSNLVCRHLAFDNAIPLIKEFYEPFGIHESQFFLFNVVNGNKIKDYVTQDLIEVVNNFIKIIEKKESALVDNLQNEELRKLLMTPQSNNGTVNITNLGDKTDLKNNVTSSNFGNTQKPVDDIPLFEKLKKTFPPELKEILIKLWFKIYESYIKESKRIFNFLRKQRESISNNYNNIQQKFISFLKRPTKKQSLLLEYQLKYNKFLDDYPDLRDDDHVKEEHHQALDDLNDKIYEIIETRKNEAIEERKKIMGSGYIENEMEKFYSNLERIFQAEIDKYTGSMQLIRDYYYTLNGKVLYELPVTTVDIIKDEIDTVPLENENDPNTFPRIEKIYRTSLRVQFQYDELINKAERDRLAQIQAAATNDKKNLKPDKNKKQEVTVQEEKKEPLKYEEEMKTAIKYEKSKYRLLYIND